MSDSNRKKIYMGLAILCAIGLLLMFFLVASGHAAVVEDPVRRFFYALRGESLTQIVTVFTQAANKYFIIVVCLILLILPWTRLTFGVPLSAGSLATMLLNTGIKVMVERSRPEDILHLVEEHGFSFPSGHSSSSMFLYGMAIWLVWHYARRTQLPPDKEPSGKKSIFALRPLPLYSKKTATILTVLLSIPLIFVGLTRIYLGVHFPTDVLAGWCLGAAVGFVEAVIILNIENRKSQNNTASGSRSM